MWVYNKISQFSDMKMAKILYYGSSLLLVFIFAILAFMGNTQWRYGIISNSPIHCLDHNPCTLDVLLPDDSCEYRTARVGYLCGNEDRCYWHSTDEQNKSLGCVGDRCVAPDNTTCKGYCTLNADCTDMMDDLYIADVTSTYTAYTRCVSRGCIAYLLLHNTTLNRNAESYLDQSTIENRYLVHCLHSSCTTLPNTTTICTYYYHCAPVIIV